MILRRLIEDPRARYHFVKNRECGCGREARYYVYDHRQPHCDRCMLESIDCEVMVPVQKIFD